MAPHCQCLATLYSMGKEWLRRRLFFTKSLPFISALICGQKIVEKLVASVLVVYIYEASLTNDFTFSILEASSLTNGFYGISNIIIVFAYISVKWLSRYKTILVTVAAFVTGLVMMFLVLANTFKESGRIVMYGAIMVMAFGYSGCTLVHEFLFDQLQQEDNDPNDVEERASDRANFWMTMFGFLSSILILFSISSNDYEIKNFVVSVISLLVGGFFFSVGVLQYHNDKNLEIGNVRNLVHIVKAAFSKRHLRHLAQQISPALFYRYINTATIIEQTTPTSKTRHAKILINMLPMWITFIVFSLIDASGRTLFFQQSSNLNNTIKSFEVPIQTFEILSRLSSFIITNLYGLLLPKELSKTKRRRVTLTRIGVGLFCSILSCICAWRVEHHRLKGVAKIDPEEYINDPEGQIRMSIFWLSPQFIFLGLMKGLCKNGLDEFLCFQMGERRMKINHEFLNYMVLGLWQILSIPYMYACKAWIKDDINDSHIDRYYGLLVIFAIVNILLYICLAIKYYDNQQQVIISESEEISDHGLIQDHATCEVEIQLTHLAIEAPESSRKDKNMGEGDSELPKLYRSKSAFGFTKSVIGPRSLSLRTRRSFTLL